MHAEIQRVVASGEQRVTPYVVAAGGDFDAFEAALADDASVDAIEVLEPDGDERLYRLGWEHDPDGFFAAVKAAGATILDAISGENAWELRVVFPDDAHLTAFHDVLSARETPAEVVRLYHPRNPEEFGRYEVTPEQEEALVAALHAGYFEVPRTATLDEIATDLGISANALSARLRRGQANLVRNTLVAPDEVDQSEAGAT